MLLPGSTFAMQYSNYIPKQNIIYRPDSNTLHIFVLLALCFSTFISALKRQVSALIQYIYINIEKTVCEI